MESVKNTRRRYSDPHLKEEFAEKLNFWKQRAAGSASESKGKLRRETSATAQSPVDTKKFERELSKASSSVPPAICKSSYKLPDLPAKVSIQDKLKTFEDKEKSRPHPGAKKPKPKAALGFESVSDGKSLDENAFEIKSDGDTSVTPGRSCTIPSPAHRSESSETSPFRHEGYVSDVDSATGDLSAMQEALSSALLVTRIAQFEEEFDEEAMAMLQQETFTSEEKSFTNPSLHPVVEEEPALDAGVEAKMMMRREQVLTEIIETEKSYINYLGILIKKFVHPLKARGEHGVAQEQASKMFSNVEILASFHSRFLMEMEQTRDSEAGIGTAFEKYADFLKMYTQYLNGYEESLRVINSLQGNKKFKTFLESRRKDTECPLDLMSYLIMPVQR
jgi:hypothetical protein